MHYWICTIIFFLVSLTPSQCQSFSVLRTRTELPNYCNRSDLVMIASTGRSGSTMLTLQVEKYLGSGRVVKTHILPPNPTCYKGKIIFIFSNPDKAAESVLFQTLHQAHFGEEHFVHVETADRRWLKKIGGPYQQTEEQNLLSYDALGIYKHLKIWLHDHVKPTPPKKAQILAIKYEHLWEKETISAIRKFINTPRFKLPKQEERGHEDLYPHEQKFREMYNLGTEEAPRYAAYDDARKLWEEAPALQFFEISIPHKQR